MRVWKKRRSACVSLLSAGLMYYQYLFVSVKYSNKCIHHTEKQFNIWLVTNLLGRCLNSDSFRLLMSRPLRECLLVVHVDKREGLKDLKDDDSSLSIEQCLKQNKCNVSNE